MRRIAGFSYGLWSSVRISDRLWVRVTSVLGRLIRWPTRVSFHPERGLFEVSEGTHRIFLAKRPRVARVIWSLTSRFEELYKGYGLHKVRGLEAGLVLDVGANVGETSLLFRQLGATVHSFEPDPSEFVCLEANADELIYPHQIALWDETGSATLFLANATGDTSLLLPVESESAITVSTVTLDDWAEEHLSDGQIVDLLKLEAEGAEPEILRGAEKLLGRIRYITADVGFERPGEGGLDSTLPAAANYLLKKGFSILWVGLPRLVIVLKNDALVETA